MGYICLRIVAYLDRLSRVAYLDRLSRVAYLDVSEDVAVPFLFATITMINQNVVDIKNLCNV